MSHFQILYTENSVNLLKEAPLHNEIIALYNDLSSVSEKTAIQVTNSFLVKNGTIIKTYEKIEECSSESEEEEIFSFED
jgi:hypothetical protein